MSLLGIGELDVEVLDRLPVEELFTVACLSKYFYNLVDVSWDHRVIHDFGLEVKRYRPVEECAQWQYLRLIRMKNAEQSLLDEFLDELIVWRDRNKLKLQPWYINTIAERGRLDILIWLYQYDLLPTGRGADRAAGMCHLKILDWLESKGVLPTSTGMDWACERENGLEVLEWGWQRGILPTDLGARLANHYGRLDISVWLRAQNIEDFSGDVPFVRDSIDIRTMK